MRPRMKISEGVSGVGFGEGVEVMVGCCCFILECGVKL